MIKSALLLFAAVVCITNAANLPTNFLKCKRDNQLSACLLKAIPHAVQLLLKGNSELKLAPIDPLTIPSLIIGEGKGTVHVVQHYENVNFIGNGKARLQNLKATATPTTFTLTLEAFTPEFAIAADYNMTGQILFFKVTGNGKCTITSYDLTTKIDVVAETFEKKGVTYLDVKDVKLKLSPKKMTYNFENLFGGDPAIGNDLNKVLNESWEKVFEDVQEGYEEAIGLIYKDYMNKLFHKVPYDEALPL